MAGFIIPAMQTQMVINSSVNISCGYRFSYRTSKGEEKKQTKLAYSSRKTDSAYHFDFDTNASARDAADEWDASS